MRRMSLVLFLILAAGGVSRAAAGFAQDEGPSVPVPAPPSETELPAEMAGPDTAELSAQDLEAWLAGFIPYALERGDIAGAVVVVVDDGEVLFEQGYGHADVEAETPVDAATTLFRIGSVSKLFTWTAVMQLVEAGKLDLDGDVNQWLDFEIPPFDGAPVTLRNILTHTPGFEENAKELMSADLAELDTLRDAVADWVPERIFPAGTTPAYSNYATALAGYIVERVSGQPFDDYIEQHILDPLGMQYTTFRQPLPERLEPHMSKGYQLGSEAPKPYELIAMAPAGSVAASGADMARFMIAHLQNGRYGEAQILQADTAEIMHTTAAPGIPPLNRMMLGFYETNVNGRRVIAHGGDTQWFHSYLHLFLDEGTGISTQDAIELSAKPIAITHANCRALADHPRNKSDEAIRALAARGGVMGITGVRMFVRDREPTTVEHIVDHIDHVEELAGIEHVGIGSDADLNGYDDMPSDDYERLKAGYKESYAFREKIDTDGYDHPRKVYDLTEVLLRRGYSDADIEAVLGGNFRRLLAEVWV